MVGLGCSLAARGKSVAIQASEESKEQRRQIKRVLERGNPIANARQTKRISQDGSRCGSKATFQARTAVPPAKDSAVSLEQSNNEGRDREGIAENLLQTEDDSRLVQIVRRHLHAHPIAGSQTDEMFPHLARNMGQHAVFVVQLDAEHRSRENSDDFAFHLNILFHTHLAVP